MTASTLKILETNRKLYAGIFEKYSLDQLNKIPAGFNNNMIWNMGHIVASQQSLIYKLSSLDMHISEDFFNLYKPGTKPLRDATQAEADEIKILVTGNIDKTKADIDAGKFVTFTERQTLTGFLLSNLQDAFEFVNYHEAMHLGVIMSIRKFV